MTTYIIYVSYLVIFEMLCIDVINIVSMYPGHWLNLISVLSFFVIIYKVVSDYYSCYREQPMLTQCWLNISRASVSNVILS